MVEQLKSHELQRIAKFAAALSTATERVNDLSAQLGTLANSSRAAALRIADFSANTARTMAQSQALATACQCKCSAALRESNQSTSLLGQALSVMFVGAGFVAAAKLWRDAGVWLLKPSIGRAVTARVAAAAIVVSEAVIGSEVLTSIAAGVSAVVASLALPEAVLTTAVIASGTALLLGISYLLWRDWTAIMRIIRKVGAALSEEAMTFIRNLASVIVEEPDADSDDTGGDGGIAREGSRRRYAFAPSGWTSIVTSLLRLSPNAFAILEQSQSGRGSQSLGISFPRVATAMLAAPLLLTPATTGVPLEQMRNDTTSATSVVINSAPTIVINSAQAEDIEPRILEVLRQHREAIYTQWCDELKRRQRTEF